MSVSVPGSGTAAVASFTENATSPIAQAITGSDEPA